MKFIEKIELVVKLKERIAEAQATDEVLASQLESLLNQIIATSVDSPVI